MKFLCALVNRFVFPKKMARDGIKCKYNNSQPASHPSDPLVFPKFIKSVPDTHLRHDFPSKSSIVWINMLNTKDDRN